MVSLSWYCFCEDSTRTRRSSDIVYGRSRALVNHGDNSRIDVTKEDHRKKIRCGRPYFQNVGSVHTLSACSVTV